ncbi:MAG: UbiA family prenyltransferase [Myxococcales bacterium]|nr:UbiA family prenyltransferase [Myxococcales bacterium]
MLDWIARIAAPFEESKAPIAYFFGGFIFWIWLRTLIEAFVFQFDMGALMMVHFTLSYLSLVLWMALTVGVFAGRNPIKVLRLMLVAYVFVLLAPTLDFIIQDPIQYTIAYINQVPLDELGRRYLTFFGPLEAEGITPGMRIEIALVLCMTSVYILAQSRSVVRMVLGAIASWTVIFFHCAYLTVMPTLAALLRLNYTEDPVTGNQLYCLLCCLASLGIVARGAREQFWAVFKDTRFLRVLHYELLFALGLAFAKPPRHFDFGDFIATVVVFVAVWLGWTFAVMSNNYYDIEADRINAPERPLVAGAMDPEAYLKLSFWIFALALTLALSASFLSLFFVAMCGIAYFIYSAPPLRLKARWQVSKVAIGINSVCCVFAGYCLWSKTMLTIPLLPIGLILVGFTMGAHVIDLKDVKGDEASGIKNLVTMLGLRRAQRVLGAFVGTGHLGFFAFTYDVWFGWAAGVAGIAQWIAITRERYRDSAVLIIQDAMLACAVVFVWQMPVT